MWEGGREVTDFSTVSQFRAKYLILSSLAAEMSSSGVKILIFIIITISQSLISREKVCRGFSSMLILHKFEGGDQTGKLMTD